MSKSQQISRGFKRLGLLLAVAVALSACGDNYDSKVRTLSTLMQWMQIGGSQDQWLQKQNLFDGIWDKVALIFGYGDDYDACTEIVGALRQSYPQWQYRCIPAN
jgi:hypothetical protein